MKSRLCGVGRVRGGGSMRVGRGGMRVARGGGDNPS